MSRAAASGVRKIHDPVGHVQVVGQFDDPAGGDDVGVGDDPNSEFCGRFAHVVRVRGGSVDCLQPRGRALRPSQYKYHIEVLLAFWE